MRFAIGDRVYLLGDRAYEGSVVAYRNGSYAIQWDFWTYSSVYGLYYERDLELIPPLKQLAECATDEVDLSV